MKPLTTQTALATAIYSVIIQDENIGKHLAVETLLELKEHDLRDHTIQQQTQRIVQALIDAGAEFILTHDCGLPTLLVEYHNGKNFSTRRLNSEPGSDGIETLRKKYGLTSATAPYEN